MPAIYNYIESQINLLMTSLYTDNYGNYVFSSVVPNIKWLQMLIYVISFLIYITFVLIAGLFLWNQGLVPLISVLQPIGESSRRVQASPFVQFILMLLALMTFF